MVKDTVITIGRRVIPAPDTTFVISELKPIGLPELKGCELNLTEVVLPVQEIEPLPALNSYICNQDSVIMHTSTLPEVNIIAYPLDGYLYTASMVALSIFTLWYISGSINSWKHLCRDIRKCIFVA